MTTETRKENKMDWKEKERRENAEWITKAYKDENGVYRWKSNDRVPFDDMLKCWNLDSETLQKCKDARNADNEEFLAEYRERMKDYEPSDEELFEMRSAFGEGAEVVNVITGKVTKL